MEYVTSVFRKYMKGEETQTNCNSNENETVGYSRGSNQRAAEVVKVCEESDGFQEKSSSTLHLSGISDNNESVLSHGEKNENSDALKGSDICKFNGIVPSLSKENMGEFSDRQLQMSDLQEKSSLEIEIRQKSDLKNQNQIQRIDQSLKHEVLHYQKLLTDYEKTISNQCSELEKLKHEHETTSRHFATLELAFSDVLQKYDRSKIIVDGFKSNEEALTQNLQIAEEKLKQNEAKYESLKTYAKAQIEKCNVEILNVRDKYDFESSKLRALIKRLEIKCSSLETSLNQKTEECDQLSALCDDITGKQV